MSPTPPDDPLVTRVHDLEMESGQLREQVAHLQREMKDASALFDTFNKDLGELAKHVAWLRNRLAHVLPERAHCPKCKAIVHRAATACGACGASWGKPPNPNEGLPT